MRTVDTSTHIHPDFMISRLPVVMAEGTHPATFRTRKLSPPAPMVLQGRPCGRVGRRGIIFGRGRPSGRPLLVVRPLAVLDVHGPDSRDVRHRHSLACATTTTHSPSNRSAEPSCQQSRIRAAGEGVRRSCPRPRVSPSAAIAPPDPPPGRGRRAAGSPRMHRHAQNFQRTPRSICRCACARRSIARSPRQRERAM